MIWKANPHIVEKLREVGALMAHIPIKHSYMHCWRHKTPVIYRATAQWFVGMDIKGKDGKTLRERALEGIEATAFTPAWGQARLHSMIANRPDWCISRQRNWGVPIPFFLHKQTGELHPRTVGLMEEAAKRVELEASMPGSNSTRQSCWVPKRRITIKSPIPWMSGSTLAPPTATYFAVRTPMATKAARGRTSTWKAPTSTVVGSTHRCSPVQRLMAIRRIVSC